MADTALIGVLLLLYPRNATAGKVHLAAIGVAHTTDPLVVGPAHRGVRVLVALPFTAQIQNFLQAEAFQLCPVGSAGQRIQIAAAVEQAAPDMPPIAIALSTTFCPKKWSPDERRNGIVNYVMGLCFVTEGAIPYAAADPLRVLPSCIIGSALSGALSMVFGCALRAPHGGIFVFPVVDHALLYVVALAVGSAVGAVILSLLKKDYVEE